VPDREYEVIVISDDEDEEIVRNMRLEEVD
jgi:hypothetical protein